MARMQTVNEDSTAYLGVSFYNEDKTLQAPTSASYRIHDVATGEQVRADTSLTPATSVEIELTPEDNAIINQLSQVEHRAVTVTAMYGAGKQTIEQYRYEVRNLQFHE